MPDEVIEQHRAAYREGYDAGRENRDRPIWIDPACDRLVSRGFVAGRSESLIEGHRTGNKEE